LSICDFLSTDISLVQGRGGNISIKYNDKFIIKSSGYKMSEITFTDGFTLCSKNNNTLFLNEKDYENYSKNLIYSSNSKPSMEVGFHNSLNHKIIIHTHPIYLNAILCSKESKKIINYLFNNLDYIYVEYITPGYKLSNFFNYPFTQKIFFLENHGLVICSNRIKDAMNLTKKINIICENWLKDNSNEFIKETKIMENKHLFPDSVVFNSELKEIDNYILNLIYKSGLTPKFLSYQEVQEIQNLESEQYRKIKNKK
jgi:ribulose-5-phosphate 4-epimerase/fuculose-1-phosphate aldolase